MCLLLIALDVVPDAPLLLLGNRDEFHERPSAAARPWSEDERIVGGRDLVAGGSWLAVSGTIPGYRRSPPPAEPARARSSGATR